MATPVGWAARYPQQHKLSAHSPEAMPDAVRKWRADFRAWCAEDAESQDTRDLLNAGLRLELFEANDGTYVRVPREPD